MDRIQWNLLPILLFLFISVATYGQDLSFGFKAGLSNTSLSGPLETLPTGEKLEKIKANKSFVLSLLFNVNFTDQFLLQTELMYNQKGYNYQYDGPSYAILRTADEKFTFEGNRDLSVNISNTYVQIPVSLSYKFFDRIQLQAGVYGSLLAASTGAGRVIYSDIPEIPGEVRQTLNYNYRSNKARGASLSEQQVRINNELETIAGQVGAYYDYEEKNKGLYKTFDAGLHGGANIFINQSLFLGIRYSHGLLDITRDSVDRTYRQLDKGSLIFVDKDDRYSAWEFTIGFSF